jgi:anti-sigma factor RsiW
MIDQPQRTDHLTPAQLTALADGELAGDELLAARAHIDACLPCARNAIDEYLMKAAVAKAGRRYEPAAGFSERMSALAANEAGETRGASRHTSSSKRAPAGSWIARAGWTAAAAVLLAMGAWQLLQLSARRGLETQQAAMVAEACDLHIAALAANQPPQVVSSDRHTVKPWFQGKLPFSFNLPETLPDGATLDGANLAYLGHQPVAQLLFSVGHHRVSVFLEERTGGDAPGAWSAAHQGFNQRGFNVDGFSTGDLDAIAVSDVDPARLAELTTSLQEAQTLR